MNCIQVKVLRIQELATKKCRKGEGTTNQKIYGPTIEIKASSNLQKVQIRILIFNALRSVSNSWSRNLPQSHWSISLLNCQQAHTKKWGNSTTRIKIKIKLRIHSKKPCQPTSFPETTADCSSHSVFRKEKKASKSAENCSLSIMQEKKNNSCHSISGKQKHKWYRHKKLKVITVSLNKI